MYILLIKISQEVCLTSMTNKCRNVSKELKLDTILNRTVFLSWYKNTELSVSFKYRAPKYVK